MCRSRYVYYFLFFFNDTATTEIYTLSLHDALPISPSGPKSTIQSEARMTSKLCSITTTGLHFDDIAVLLRAFQRLRSEEHTSELQSQSNLVCRLLLEKKKSTAMRSSSA